VTVAGAVLMIGLDMGDGRLLERWAGEGHLPAVAGLLRNGRGQAVDTTADALHVSGWPSLYTGTHPGEHGVYYTFQPAPGHQGWLKFQGDQYGRPTFWSLLARAGVRCCVLDAPYTHPESAGATQVIDWGSWAPYWKPASTPAELVDRLTRARGRYPLGFHALDVGMDRLDPAEMSRKLVPAARAKTEAAQWLMAERPWDLFFTVYGESHAAAHYCWGDEAALRAVYEEIDRGIGALAAQAGPQATVYLVSGDGVGPNQAGWHLLPEVLRRLGYLAEPSEGGQRDDAPWIRSSCCAICCPRTCARRSPASCSRMRYGTAWPSGWTPPRWTGPAPAPIACPPTWRGISGSISGGASLRGPCRRGRSISGCATSWRPRSRH
jgi:predicted AlkP superfamily phosphohydrolase/phosphomutase